MQTGNTKAGKRKPAGVPDDAYWDAGDNEWVVPARNAAGQFHGLVKWYRPDGSLCCATEHVDGVTHGTFTRFHENGEHSRVGTFVRGVLHGVNAFTRSTAPTTENFPAGLGKHIWRCDMTFVNGQMTDGALWNKEGRRVMEDGTPFPEDRPAGVPATAHFKKDQGEYLWIEATNKSIEDGSAWARVGTWRYWAPSGVLVREESYEDGVLHGSVRELDAETGALVSERTFERGVEQPDRGAPFDRDDDA